MRKTYADSPDTDYRRAHIQLKRGAIYRLFGNIPKRTSVHLAQDAAADSPLTCPTARPPLPTLLSAPCSARPGLPALLCPPCSARPALARSALARPALARPALPALLPPRCSPPPCSPWPCSPRLSRRSATVYYGIQLYRAKGATGNNLPDHQIPRKANGDFELYITAIPPNQLPVTQSGGRPPLALCVGPRPPRVSAPVFASCSVRVRPLGSCPSRCRSPNLAFVLLLLLRSLFSVFFRRSSRASRSFTATATRSP